MRTISDVLRWCENNHIHNYYKPQLNLSSILVLLTHGGANYLEPTIALFISYIVDGFRNADLKSGKVRLLTCKNYEKCYNSYYHKRELNSLITRDENC